MTAATRRAWAGLSWLALAAVVAAVAFVFLRVVQLRDDLDAAEQARRDDRAAIAALSEGLRREQDAAVAAGQQPAAPSPEELVAETPELIQGPRGERGERGETGERGPGPTVEQVRTAVAAYLAAYPPEPGRPPTDAQVAAVVASYCAARGDCRGPVGPPGDDGASIVGPAGPAGPTGPPGPAATDAQVAAAVAAYCASGACTGPPGPPGPPGVDAPRPPRILLPALLGRQQECDLIWTPERLTTQNCSMV